MFFGQNWVSKPQMFGYEPRDSDDVFDAKIFSTRLLNVLHHVGELLSMKIVGMHITRLISAKFIKQIFRQIYNS